MFRVFILEVHFLPAVISSIWKYYFFNVQNSLNRIFSNENFSRLTRQAHLHMKKLISRFAEKKSCIKIKDRNLNTLLSPPK